MTVTGEAAKAHAFAADLEAWLDELEGRPKRASAEQSIPYAALQELEMVKSEAARVIDAVIVMGRDTEGRPKVQVRPIPGQGLAASLNISCARKIP